MSNILLKNVPSKNIFQHSYNIWPNNIPADLVECTSESIRATSTVPIKLGKCTFNLFTIRIPTHKILSSAIINSRIWDNKEKLVASLSYMNCFWKWSNASKAIYPSSSPVSMWILNSIHFKLLPPTFHQTMKEFGTFITINKVIISNFLLPKSFFKI